MILLENYLTNCFQLGDWDYANDVIKSQFDFGARTRRAIKGYTSGTFKVTLTDTELIQLDLFWTAIINGADSFNTTQKVFNIVGLKTLRFVSPPKIKELGLLSEVTFNIELID